jgi:hypothetical protein
MTKPVLSVTLPLYVKPTEPPLIFTPVPVGFVIVPVPPVNVPAQLTRFIPFTPPVDVIAVKTAFIEAPLPFPASKPPPMVLLILTSWTLRLPTEFVVLLSMPKSLQFPTLNPRSALPIASVTPSPPAFSITGLVPLIAGRVKLCIARLNGRMFDRFAPPVCPVPQRV